MSEQTEIDRLTQMRPLIMALIALVIGGTLMLLGGRWDWIEGWMVAVSYFILLVGSSLWAARYAPGMSRERVQAVANPGSLHERIILVWIPVALVVMIVVAALDGGRYRRSHVPLWVEVIGFGLVAGYMALNVWAALSNPFLSAAVRVQADREHHVITGGAYRLVRHPMYLGLCLLGLGIPLALGSWWALIPGGVFLATFVYRTWQEDRFLIANLPGYPEFAQQTNYRLIPGVW